MESTTTNTNSESASSVEVDDATHLRYTNIMQKLLNLPVPENYMIPESAEEFGTWFCHSAMKYIEKLNNIGQYQTPFSYITIPQYMKHLQLFRELYQFVEEHLFVLKLATISSANSDAVVLIDSLSKKSLKIKTQIEEIELQFIIQGIEFTEEEKMQIENTKNMLTSFAQKYE